MLYSEIIAVCSQIHTKHINTLCGQNVLSTWPLRQTKRQPVFCQTVYTINMATQRDKETTCVLPNCRHYQHGHSDRPRDNLSSAKLSTLSTWPLRQTKRQPVFCQTVYTINMTTQTDQETTCLLPNCRHYQHGHFLCQYQNTQ
jgi:hypothetical protein